MLRPMRANVFIWVNAGISSNNAKLGGTTVPNAELLVGFVCIVGAGLSGNDRRGHNHSDEGQGNQKVMHFILSLCGS